MMNLLGQEDNLRVYMDTPCVFGKQELKTI